jgi:hypothetical protein
LIDEKELAAARVAARLLARIARVMKQAGEQIEVHKKAVFTKGEPETPSPPGRHGWRQWDHE